MESKKRKNEEIDEPEAKRFNLAETTNTTTMPLNEDVLAEIFSYLNAEEMVQVVKADEMFLSSCREAFKIKYRNEYITLPIMNFDIATNEDSTDLKRNVELLHYFGDKISKLEFEFDEDAPIEERIDFDLIVTICSRKARNAVHLLRICRPIDLALQPTVPGVRKFSHRCGWKTIKHGTKNCIVETVLPGYFERCR